MFLLLLLLSSHLFGCIQKTHPTIEFVIPQGFTGEFVVVEDVLSGSENQTMLSYNVPMERLLALQTTSHFNRWYVLSAKFQNGTRIKSGASDTGSEDQAIWSLGKTSVLYQGRMVDGLYFYIGTEDDSQKYMREKVWGKKYTE